MNLFSRRSSLVLAALAAFAAHAADFDAVTNLTTCAQTVRNDFKAALKTAVNAGDMAAFKALLARLGREPSVTPQVFDLWNAAAWALADDAAVLAKKKPAEQAEIVAGFREGGTTFGLNNRPLEIGGRPALAAARLADAESVLLEMMPQKGLSVANEGRRDSTLLSMQNKVGTNKGKADAAKRLHDFALAAKPVTRDDTNAVFSAVGAFFDYKRENGDWDGYAAFARDCQKALAPMYGASVLNLKGRELGAYHRAHDEKAYDALAAEMAALPADAATLAAYFAAKDTIQNRNQNQAWTKVLALFKRFTDVRATLKPSDHARLAELLYNAAKARGDIAEAKARYAELEKIKADTTAAWNAESAREKAARSAKQPFTRDPSIPKPEGLVDRVRPGHASFLRDKHAFADAVPFYRQMATPRNVNTYYDLGYVCAAAGDRDGAFAAFAVVKTNAQAKADVKFRVCAIEAALQARDAADFAKRVAALRKMSDAEGAEGESAYDADVRFLLRVRNASRTVYSLWPDPAHRDYPDALLKLSRTLEVPEDKVSYTAKFLDGAPRTAEAALATGIFEKYPVENRFGKYSVYSDVAASWQGNHHAKELKLIKTCPDIPRLQADQPGKEGAVVVLYDTTGVHFYIRMNDPDAVKSRDGYADGARTSRSTPSRPRRATPSTSSRRGWSATTTSRRRATPGASSSARTGPAFSAPSAAAASMSSGAACSFPSTCRTRITRKCVSARCARLSATTRPSAPSGRTPSSGATCTSATPPSGTRSSSPGSPNSTPTPSSSRRARPTTPPSTASAASASPTSPTSASRWTPSAPPG